MEKENDERRHCDECWSQPRLQWKWNPLSTALSPVFPQEKMEIANIEPTQSILLSRKELRGMLATTERGPTEGGVGESWSLSGFICPGWHAAPWQRCYSHSIVSEPSHSSHTPLFVSVVPLMSTPPPNASSSVSSSDLLSLPSSGFQFCCMWLSHTSSCKYAFAHTTYLYQKE